MATKRKKRIRKRLYSREFKERAVAAMQETKLTHAELAEQLGVTAAMLYKWRVQLQTHQDKAFPGRGRPAPENEELVFLRKETKRLRQELDFIQLCGPLISPEMTDDQKYQLVHEQRERFHVSFLCEKLGVYKCNYYQWRKRLNAPATPEPIAAPEPEPAQSAVPKARKGRAGAKKRDKSTP